jgi:hypothetical protein
MDWQIRRKILYALAVVIAVSSFIVYVLKDTLFPVPTCFDKKQNGYEVGIDCGGVCALRCSSEVIPLSVLWTRILKTSNNTYDLIAMVSNKNINNATNNVPYTFTVYNEKGQPMQDIKGITVTPVNGDFPIIEQSVVISGNPRTVTIQIGDGPHYNVNEKPTSPTLSISNEHYEPGQIPRVYVTVQNKKRMTIRDLPVKVILFDQENNAYAVGSTVIPELGKEESKDVSFTWSAPLPYPPLRIRAYPIFDPFLSIQ